MAVSAVWRLVYLLAPWPAEPRSTPTHTSNYLRLAEMRCAPLLKSKSKRLLVLPARKHPQPPRRLLTRQPPALSRERQCPPIMARQRHHPRARTARRPYPLSRYSFASEQKVRQIIQRIFCRIFLQPARGLVFSKPSLFQKN